MRIEVDEDMCISSGQCVMTAGKVFEQRDDGVSQVIDENPPEDQWKAVRSAAAGCPSGAITVFND